MYAMLGTRPDIGYSIATLSQYLSNPGEEHWVASQKVSSTVIDVEPCSSMDIFLKFGEEAVQPHKLLGGLSCSYVLDMC